MNEVSPSTARERQKKWDRKNRAVRKGGPVGKKRDSSGGEYLPNLNSFPPDNAWQTSSYYVNLACNPPSQLTVQCIDFVQSERPGKQDRSGDGEGLRMCGKQGTVWMARVGLKTGYYWSKWQEWGQLQAMQMGLMNGNTGPLNWEVIKGSRHY